MVLAALLCLGLIPLNAASAAAEAGGQPVVTAAVGPLSSLTALPVVAATRYRMVFPLAGPLEVLSTFGAERDNGERSHKGVDLAAPRLTPVLAVKDGVVARVNHAGVNVVIRHYDGWTSWYLHLNNDTVGTDDGLGGGIVPGLEVGDPVTAGQVIGWVGDSGNAEPTPPHLHFELRNRWGESIDPLRSLRSAWWVDEEVPHEFAGAFWDDDELEIAEVADLLASLGLISGCGPYGLELCPDEVLTGAAAEEVLRAALGDDVEPTDHLPFGRAPGLSTFAIDAQVVFEAGCGVLHYCPNRPITRGELAAILGSVLELERTEADYFFDDDGHFAEDSINALVADGVFDICAVAGPPPFDPARTVTRAELIDTIAKGLGLIPVESCRVTA